MVSSCPWWASSKNKYLVSVKSGMPSEINIRDLDAALRPSFKPGFMPLDQVAYRVVFDDQSELFLTLSPDNFELSYQPSPRTTLTIWVKDLQLLEALLLGRASGMDAFMAGHYRSDGHIVLSQLLLYVFLPSDRALAYEVSD